MGNGLRNLFLLGTVSIILLIGLALILTIALGTETAAFEFGDTVAVIPLEGTISFQEDGYLSEGFSYSQFVEDLEKASEDPSIRAIVLRINSGGGEVVASKTLVKKVSELDKPVVAYISEVGASGAYYIASACDKIVADEDSMTGSIGVYMMFLNWKDLADEYGIKAHIIKDGNMKTSGNPFSEFSDEERAIFEGIVKETGLQFKEDVKSFRKGPLNIIRFNEVADGRILSGRQALNVGLIDETGYLEDAVELAGSLAGIEEPVIEIYEKPEVGLLDFFAMAGFNFGQGLQKGMSIEYSTMQMQ